jgi:hypothetical protein
MPDHYECLKREEIIYPLSCVHPPELFKYPRPQAPLTLLFLGWNPPKAYGGFWSLEFDDSLRTNLHRILKTLGKIETPYPGQNFLNEFLDKSYYFIHTVKCWSKPKFPGFGRDTQSKEWRQRIYPNGVASCLTIFCSRTFPTEFLFENISCSPSIWAGEFFRLTEGLRTARKVMHRADGFPIEYVGNDGGGEIQMTTVEKDIMDRTSKNLKP